LRSFFRNDAMDDLGRKTRVAWVSVFSNTILVTLKIIIGILIGSVAVISEAIHSGVDLLASFIALFAVKTAGKSPDEDHPFGHGKVENISGTLEAILIFIAAGWILYESIQKLLTPQPIESAGWGVGIMLISALMNFFVSRKLFQVGKETDSVALEADAWHLRTDVYTSLGVMGGLGIYWVARIFWAMNLQWLDPVAAMGVAGLIILAAYRLTVKSARDLLDASLPDEERWIRRELKRKGLPIHGFHHLRTRKAGATRFAEFHLVVDKGMSVKDSHQISSQIEKRIQDRFPDSKVIIHVEPCDGTCSGNCLSGCMVEEEKRPGIRGKP
jgi:cation diffusion facilitator family transporter